jgi:hypothetical protein|tara:strand:+ start:51 stop:203 length:153 start_codon:yes stop_codon:yes gene_type:complete
MEFKWTIDCGFCFKQTFIQVEEDQDIVKYCPLCGECPEIEADETELLFDS